MLLLAAAACTADGRDQASARRRPGSSAAPSVTAVPTSPRTVVPQRRWLAARIRLDNPDGLAAADDAVFVKTDDGRVVRIDPRTNAIVREVELDTAHDRAHYCQGIGSDGRTLWACAASDTTTDVVRLDPRTLDVTARARVDKVFDQYSLPVVGGKVWVLAGDGDRLTSVDTATGAATTFSLPHRCFQLAATQDVVYATCLLDDRVIAVDARSGRLVGHTEIAGPTNVAVHGSDVWVSGSAGLFRLDPDLVPRALYRRLSAGAEGDLLATGSAVWVRNPAQFLLRIDPTRGDVSRRYAVPSALSGGSLLLADGALWTSASDDSAVLRVSLPPG